MITELDISGIKSIRGLTPHHEERRKKYVGASMLPALVGLDEYRGPVDLWMELTGQVPPGDSSEPAAIGTAAESAIQTLTEAATGWKLTRRGAWCVYKGFMAATRDWSIVDRPGLVQGKTSGKADEWATEPPARVVVQVHGEMICAEEEVAYAAAILGGFGPLKFKLYQIQRDEELCKSLIEVAHGFHACVQEKKRPDGVARLDTLKRVVWASGVVAEAPASQMQLYLDARAKRMAADAEAKAQKQVEDSYAAALLQLNPGAEAIEAPQGRLVRTEVAVKEYVVKARVDQRITFKTAEQVQKALKAGKKDIDAKTLDAIA